MKIFKAEQWNLQSLLPLFEEYRVSQGMEENTEKTKSFLNNRIRFGESIFFIAIINQKSVGFIQLYPRLSSIHLQRYWQLTDIFVQDLNNKEKIYSALIAKAKEFVLYTQSKKLVTEQTTNQKYLLEQQGFKINTKENIFELTI
ncbi:hypothetical protein EV697_105109 [Bisgaardia hudsonensis]|uniref:N-acetyltransferase domain-containing protein n=1 Tax=Bisgaardia hudsonensis TaxID=109472 RepID=A0A4R2MWQ1_9PAST|nr:GNAT family N-acetyltransferase [Bisgaardia hudsonensis]QLB13664.1 hypothetical protein A6A11_08605 [Bisgaardia hudsonensis]TCP11997.1 hypothetical protein EV697_105109 [Bisgaardia hudsonensis]